MRDPREDIGLPIFFFLRWDSLEDSSGVIGRLFRSEVVFLTGDSRRFLEILGDSRRCSRKKSDTFCRLKALTVNKDCLRILERCLRDINSVVIELNHLFECAAKDSF